MLNPELDSAWCGSAEDHMNALRDRLKELHKRIDDVTPRCRWSDSGYPDWDTQTARDRYRELTQQALKIEHQLGY